MKKFLALTLAILVCLAVFAGCASNTDTTTTTTEQETEETSSSTSSGDKVVVGVAMPTKEQPIWAAYGDKLEAAFQEAGFDTIVEFAEDDTSRQIMQIENMITKGAKYLIISAVDSYSLSDVCNKAAESGIRVIAGDRLINNTENVDYYVTFDLIRMGEIQGEYIESALGLDEGKGPFTIEIFSGSPDDTNSVPFYEGAMNILQPYLDNGMLICKSGQVDLSVNGTLKWDSATAQSRMDNILSRYYTDEPLDAVLVAADCLGTGVISSLTSMGYGTEDLPFPVITGQDCELTAVKYIMEGKQSMTVFLDPVVFADKCLSVVQAMESGAEVETDTTYNNDVKDVPTITYDPYLIDASNIDHLVEVGFYTESDIYG